MIDASETQAVREDAGDLLYGAPAIAAFLNVRTRQAYHLIEKAGLPSFKLGGKVCARRSTLAKWLVEQEAAGQPDPSGKGAGDE
ncbi:excisionase family DNA binding protein [Azospirillum agricola]|uniref:hypothetical protein n=1 Tax=Azospirillum agricola TaxID=1720247 RepID=UPI001AE5DBAF|nr:hypothetical protein [Azospirillum agricola]MBP2229380.1 excisionase family DNA binding protein [Azospirillum agricola]